MIEVELAYASANQQVLLKLSVETGTTIKALIEQSGILSRFPELVDSGPWQVGIFSQRTNLAHIVQAGDRIEVYRPLKIDPKAIRRLRARNQ